MVKTTEDLSQPKHRQFNNTENGQQCTVRCLITVSLQNYRKSNDTNELNLFSENFSHIGKHFVFVSCATWPGVGQLCSALLPQ